MFKIGKPRKMTMLTRVGYGMGGLLSSGALTFTHSYMVLFIATECGLSAGEAAIIASAAIYLDAILAPIMGFISDNFYGTAIGRKFGRRRFWILCAIPLMLAEPAIFVVTPFGFPYYLLMYMLYNIGYSFASTSLTPLAIEMSEDFKERSYLSGMKRTFANVTGFLLAALTAFGFGVFGENNPFSYFVIASMNASLMIFGLVVLYISTWEKSPEEVLKEEITNVGEGVKKLFVDIFSTFRNKAFRRLVLCWAPTQIATAVWGASYSYFIVFCLGIPKSYASGVEMPGKIVAIICVGAWVAMLAKGGFHKPYLVAMFGGAATMLCFIGTGVGSWMEILPQAAVMAAYPIIFCVWKFFYTGFGYLPDVMLNYIPDVDELITRRRREGIYSAASRLVSQLFQALVTTGFGFVLVASGFISTKGKDIVQPISVPISISLTLLIGISCMFLLAAFLSRYFELDKETCEIVQKECARIREGGLMADVDPEVKKICEHLTGMNYEDLFAHNTIGWQEAAIVPAA